MRWIQLRKRFQLTIQFAWIRLQQKLTNGSRYLYRSNVTFYFESTNIDLVSEHQFEDISTAIFIQSWWKKKYQYVPSLQMKDIIYSRFFNVLYEVLQSNSAGCVGSLGVRSNTVKFFRKSDEIHWLLFE